MNLQENIRRILREIEEDKIQIRLGRSAERHFGKVQNIIIMVDDQDITSEDDVPGLGKMNIVIKDNEIIVGDIFIPEKYRKQGIATIVYQKISDYFNLPIVNSKTKGFNQTIEGGHIWKKRERFEPKNLQEHIRRILKEETEGIDSFLSEVTQVHDMSDELKNFVKKFIEESNCKRINFSKFNIPAMGLALESGVLINSMSLRQPLPFLLFLIFHEITHQYQFKKYGEEMMYNCYLGEIPESEAAEFMKHTEEVADNMAYRKIRELQKLNLIGPYTPPQVYKNIPIQQITMMVNNYRNDMRRKNINSPKKVSEYFYNMVKSEL